MAWRNSKSRHHRALKHGNNKEKKICIFFFPLAYTHDGETSHATIAPDPARQTHMDVEKRLACNDRVKQASSQFRHSCKWKIQHGMNTIREKDTHRHLSLISCSDIGNSPINLLLQVFSFAILENITVDTQNTVLQKYLRRKIEVASRKRNEV